MKLYQEDRQRRKVDGGRRNLPIQCRPAWSSVLLLAFLACFQTSLLFPGDALAGGRSIFFVGDVMLDRGVGTAIRSRGIDTLFASTDSLFRASDYVVANLECPAGKRRYKAGNAFIFCADPAWMRDLARHHITHVSLANNHSNDQGPAGLRETIDTLNADSIGIIGVGKKGENECDPTIVDSNDGRIALFGAVHVPRTGLTPKKGQPAPCRATAEELAQAIGPYRRAHPLDIVIAVLHWGLEYRAKPTDAQRNGAHLLADSGASAVIGHHPHLVEPVEVYNNVPICYSLGNFIFDQHDAATKKMIAAKLYMGNGKIDSVEVFPLISRRSIPFRATEREFAGPAIENATDTMPVRVIYKEEAIEQVAGKTEGKKN